MKPWLFLAASALAALPTDPRPAPISPPPPAARDQRAELAKDYSAAVKRWRDEVRAAAKESKDKEAAARAKHPVRDFWPRFEELSKRDGRALVWMVEGCEDYLDSRSAVIEKKTELVGRLVRENADAEWAAEDLVEMLPRQRVWFDEAWVRARLDELARASKNNEGAGAALYELAQRLTGSKASDDERKQGEALLARIEGELAGTKAAAKVTERKTAAFYEVGGVPGDFEAKDPDGVAFKLSDYRGKVVMLDFWGFW
jgi:hypothetical protein